MEKDFPFRNWLRIALILCAGQSVGCNRWRVPTEVGLSPEPAVDLPLAPQGAEPKAPPKAKRAEEKPEDFAWFESVKSSHEGTDYLWRNDRLEEISLEVDGAAELLEYVAKGDFEKSTSATIQLARLERGTRDAELERIARSTSQKKTTRLAAIETLGKSPGDDVTARLVRIAIPLRDGLLKNQLAATEPLDDDRILAAIISSLAERKAELQDFESCLSPTGPVLSCAALMDAETRLGASPVSEAAISCFGHPSPIVRTGLLAWIEAVRDESAVGEVLKITRGEPSEVYFPAIQTLGAFSNAQSTARLEELSRDQSPRVRGAALAALIRRDTPTAMKSALAETNWQVKKGIAEFVVEPTTESQWSYLEALLLDPAPAVQQALMKTVATWSVASITRASFIGMRSPMPFIRQGHWDGVTKALGIEREHFPKFDPLANEELRSLQIAKIQEALGVQAEAAKEESSTPSLSLDANRLLVATWKQSDESERALVELKLLRLGSELTKVLDTLSNEEIRALPTAFWTNVAAVADPRFAAALPLRSPDVGERREAAAKLVEQYNSGVPPTSLLAWLDPLLAPEEDILVWRRVLLVAKKASDAASRAAAARLASTAVTMDALDIRVTACGILEAAPPHAEYVAAIEPLLDSASQLERVAAIRTLGKQGELSATAREKLTSLLAESASETRIEAALVLANVGSRVGILALKNAALQGAESERRLAVERLGETACPAHIPLLIGILDESPTLRQAALGSLGKLAGEEVISAAEKPFMSSTESAARWKAWYATHKPLPSMSIR